MGSAWEGLVEALLRALEALRGALGGYGPALVALAALERLVFLPLTLFAIRTQQAVAELRPEVEAVRAEHLGDPQRAGREVARLYGAAGVRPILGCLPLVVNLGLMLATFFAVNLLLRRGQLAGQGWLGLPSLDEPTGLGWIWPPARWGRPARIYAALALVGGLVLDLALRQQPPAPADDPAARRRRATAQRAMPGLFALLALGFPVALTLLWTTFSALMVVESALARRALVLPPWLGGGTLGPGRAGLGTGDRAGG